MKPNIRTRLRTTAREMRAAHRTRSQEWTRRMEPQLRPH
jgi:hypothetical protein